MLPLTRSGPRVHAPCPLTCTCNLTQSQPRLHSTTHNTVARLPALPPTSCLPRNAPHRARSTRSQTRCSKRSMRRRGSSPRRVTRASWAACSAAAAAAARARPRSRLRCRRPVAASRSREDAQRGGRRTLLCRGRRRGVRWTARRWHLRRRYLRPPRSRSRSPPALRPPRRRCRRSQRRRYRRRRANPPPAVRLRRGQPPQPVALGAPCRHYCQPQSTAAPLPGRASRPAVCRSSRSGRARSRRCRRCHLRHPPATPMGGR